MRPVGTIIASSVGPQIVIWLPVESWPQFRLGSSARSALRGARQPLRSAGLL